MADVMPGTTSNGTPAAARAAASSPPRAKAHDRGARAAPLDEQGVDVLLGQADVAGRLAHVDALGSGRRQVEQGLLRQAVVDDDVGAPQHVEGPHGEQAGVARPGTDQMDRHGRPSRVAPP